MLGFHTLTDNALKLEADYRTTDVDLYTNVAAQLAKGKTLEVLSFAEREYEHHDRFPSWVPRWDLDNWPLSIGYNYGTCNWTASGDEAPRVEANLIESVLSAAGVEIDVIKEGLEIDQWFPKNRRYSECRVLEMWRSGKYCTPSYPNGESRFDVFASVFIAADREYELCRCCTKATLLKGDFASYLVKCYESLDERTEEDEKSITELKKHITDCSRRKSFESGVKEYCAFRSFFVTEKGYMGLGPIELCPGDITCILYGGIIPYVLRPLGDGYYRLLGEAYVHGMMEGQVLELRDEDKLVEKIFHIR